MRYFSIIYTIYLSYQGLLDELVGIQYNKITVDACVISDIAEPPKLPSNMNVEEVVYLLLLYYVYQTVTEVKPDYKPGDKVTLTLTNNDNIFANIRDLSIERIGAYMQEKGVFLSLIIM